MTLRYRVPCTRSALSSIRSGRSPSIQMNGNMGNNAVFVMASNFPLEWIDVGRDAHVDRTHCPWRGQAN